MSVTSYGMLLLGGIRAMVTLPRYRLVGTYDNAQHLVDEMTGFTGNTTEAESRVRMALNW